MQSGLRPASTPPMNGIHVRCPSGIQLQLSGAASAHARGIVCCHMTGVSMAYAKRKQSGLCNACSATLFYSTLRLVLPLRRAGCTAGMPLVFDLLLYLRLAVLPAV
jgi:hypothetical protein